MKKIMFVMFAVSVMWLVSCSNPSDSVNNWEPTVSNGGSTQVIQGGGSQSNQKPNECDIGGDFDLEYWKDKIYVNRTLPPQCRVESNHIGLQSNVSDTLEFYLTIQINGNKMIVNKDARWGPKNNWFEIDSIKKTSNNRVDIELKPIKH